MKRIKIGIVGLRFGGNLLRNEIAKGPGAEWLELAAVCDQNPERLEPYAKDFQVRATRDFEELLADPEIGAIGLFTGPVGRAALIRRCFRAGKDVMTTKPFEVDPAEAAAVLKEAAALGRVLHMNSPCATLPDDFRQIEAWRKKYDLGRPLAGRCECWYKKVEKADGSWYDDPEQCPVAPILRLGIYGINDLVRVFGEPESVQVMESRLLTGRPTPDLAQLTVRFASGAIAHTVNGWCLQPGRGADSLAIFYENGTIYRGPALVPRPEGRIQLAVVPAANKDGQPAETVTVGYRQLSMVYQWEVFARAIHGEKPTEPTSPEIIVNGVRVLAAMKRAMKSGRTEKA